MILFSLRIKNAHLNTFLTRGMLTNEFVGRYSKPSNIVKHHREYRRSETRKE